MTRRRRIFLVTSTTLATIVAGVYVAAVLDMSRERRARRYLGDRLYVETRGSGDPVVFLPGMQGSTRFWGRDFDALAPSHRLIFVDELGFGRSPWPEHIRYSLDDQLGALRRTLVHEGATRNVTLVAHSFGAVLAAHYAARHPDEVRRLVLLGTPVFDSEEQGRVRIRQMSSLGALFAFNRPLAMAACTTVCAFRPLLRRVLPRLERSRPADVVRDSVVHDFGAVEGAVDILLHEPVRKPIMAIGSRVVFIHGVADRVTPFAQVQALARTSGARAIAVDGGHHDYLERSRAIVLGEIERK